MRHNVHPSDENERASEGRLVDDLAISRISKAAGR